MATTTNFGWTTPDDTDLVKDGALAIRTLGSAIDTSLVDLKGGTTGQVLSKASNTDMDFSWITASSGKLLQAVSATYSTEVTSASTSLIDTGLTATITPTKNTSKILVLVSHPSCQKSDGNSQNGIVMDLLRGATVIQNITSTLFYTNSTVLVNGAISTAYLDSPATTSATTYKTQFRNIANAANVKVQVGTTASSIVLLEIGA